MMLQRCWPKPPQPRNIVEILGKRRRRKEVSGKKLFHTTFVLYVHKSFPLKKGPFDFRGCKKDWTAAAERQKSTGCPFKMQAKQKSIDGMKRLFERRTFGKTLIRGSICMINSPKWNSLLANEIPQIGLEPENYRLLPWLVGQQLQVLFLARSWRSRAPLSWQLFLMRLKSSLSQSFQQKKLHFPTFFRARYTHTWVIIRSRSSSSICITISSPALLLTIYCCSLREREEKRCVDGAATQLKTSFFSLKETLKVFLVIL